MQNCFLTKGLYEQSFIQIKNANLKNRETICAKHKGVFFSFINCYYVLFYFQCTKPQNVFFFSQNFYLSNLKVMIEILACNFNYHMYFSKTCLTS